MKTLTLAAFALMTLGLVLGVVFVTNPKLREQSTEAAIPPELTEVNNQDVNIEFTRLSPHNRWDYMLSGVLCFTNNPPINARWKVGVYHDALKNPEIPIGGSVEHSVTVPSAARCNGAPALIFNAPINLPPSSRLPEGADCLPEGDVKVRIDTKGPPWQIQHDVAIIRHSFFCPDATPRPTQNPSITPTPVPPGNVTINLQLQGTWKNGFNEFQATAMACDFNNTGEVNWESCAINGNKQSNSDITRKGGDRIDKTVNLTITNTAGGDKALVIFYDYKRQDGKADNTGIQVETVSNTTCSPGGIDFGAYVCGIEIPTTGTTKSFKLSLPDPTATTYELRLGKEGDSQSRVIMDFCAHAIDSNNKNESSSREQCNSYIADNNKVRVVYYNATANNEKLYWLLGRCNGTIDNNEGVCEINSPTDTQDLVQNFFEQENVTTVNAGQIIVCTLDKSKYPATENETNVRTSGTVSCETAQPSPTPIYTATPTLSPRPNATQTPTPVPPTATPTPGSTAGGGYYTSISFYNGSSKNVTSITTITCYGTNGSECNSEVVNTSIAPNQRGVVETDLVLPRNVHAYIVKCRVTFEGSATPINCPNEVTTPLRQNVLYKIVASGGGVVNGQGVTEIEACDVNKDQCCNANDFSVVATKYAEEVQPTDQNTSDINGDGIINGFDLVYTQTNFGKGQGCRLNLAPELRPDR